LYIPARIYSPEPPLDAQDLLTETAKMVLGCLYTRHSSGRIREKHLRTIISSSQPWVPPFVVQLIGEAMKRFVTDLVGEQVAICIYRTNGRIDDIAATYIPAENDPYLGPGESFEIRTWSGAAWRAG
jgi:hypothetical protein